MKWKRLLAGAAALAAIALTGGVLAAPADASSTTYQNALYNGADPAVIKDGSYYYFAHADGNNKIYISKSKTLADRGTNKLVYEFPSGQWNSKEQWGPNALFKWNGDWYLYYMGDDGNNVNHRLGVLKANSTDPQGSWTDLGQVNTGGSWAISGFPFQDYNGNWYLTWSGWQNPNDGFPQNTYIAPMTNPWTIGTRVLISSPTNSWENSSGAVQEGQIVLKRNGKLFLIYSCNASWTDNYCLGMLTWSGGSVLSASSWVKSSGPVFQQTANVKGPGGPSIVPSADGTQDWLVYHSNAYSNSGWLRRVVNMKQITYDGSGNPVFGSPSDYGTQLSLPSGDPGYQKPTGVAVGKNDGLPRLLWTYPDGKAKVETLNAGGTAVTSTGNFGPFPGFRAISIDVGLDNQPRVLWAKTDGTASLWTLNTAGTAQASAADYGPFTDWTPTDVTVGYDNQPRVLWSKTDGTASVWTFNTAGTSNLNAANFTVTGFTPTAISIGSDNKPRVLWSTTPSTGQVVVSRYNTTGTALDVQNTLTAPAGWLGRDLATGNDNIVRVMWDQAATDKASIWVLNAAGSALASSADFGPFADWEPQSMTAGADNKVRIAWRYLSERVSYWQLNAAGNAADAQVEYQGSY